VTAGSLVTRTFRAWWGNLGKLLLLTLLLLVPALLVGLGAALLLPAPEPDPGDATVVFALVGLVVLLMVPLALVVLGGITYGVFRWLAGQKAGLGEMLGQGARRIVGLFLAGALMGLATLAGYLLLVVPGILVATAASVALPAVVVERLGPVRALRRSFQLTRGHRWSLFAAFLAILGIQFVFSLVGGLVQVALPIVGALVSLAVSLVFASVPYVLPAVAYHDLRVLEEGVDTSQLVRVFE
jgi:hypothetical protein